MIRITLHYFAALREARGTDTEQLDVPENTPLRALYEQLFPAGPLGRIPVQYAKNGAWSSAEATAEPGDEIVFLPPVGGG